MAGAVRALSIKILIALGLVTLVITNLAPPVWGVLASFKSNEQIVATHSPLVGFTPTAQNYRDVLASGYMAGMRNSAFYSLAAVIIGLVVGSLAAYGFDRFTFVGQSSLILLVIASIPLALGATALIIPNFLFFTGIGLTNHWYTLPIIYSVHSLPMAIWMFKGSMEGIPRELDEAAYIDGASSFATFRRVILPLSKPVIGAAGFMIFIHAWNEFVAGSVMVDSPGLRPVQPLLYSYISDFGREWGLLTAAACLAVVPVVAIYCFFGRLLISGLTRGAVKA